MKKSRHYIQTISICLLVATLWNSFGWLGCFMMNDHGQPSHHEMSMIHHDHDEHMSHEKKPTNFCFFTKDRSSSHSMMPLNFFEYRVPMIAEEIQENSFELVAYGEYETSFFPQLTVSDVFKPPQG